MQRLLIIIYIIDVTNRSKNINERAKRLNVTTPGKFNERSRKGVCGLQNLGNTCFMNSSLQCLSNVYELSQFLLSNEFLNDLNEKNALGTGGKLTVAYAELVKEMWEGT